jgi:hypothetical protein
MNSVNSNILRNYLKNYQANDIYPSNDPKDRFINTISLPGIDIILNKVDDPTKTQDIIWRKADSVTLFTLG